MNQYSFKIDFKIILKYVFCSVDIYYLSNNNILDNIFRVKTYGGKAYLSKNIFAEMTF